MHAKLFLAAALAVSASGSVIDERDLQECASAAAKVSPLLTEIPQPDPTLASFIARQDFTVTDPCVLPPVTGSMAAEATSYYSTLSKWYDSHKKDFQNVIKACDDVDEVKEALSSASLCSEISFAKATGSSSSSSDDKKDSKDNGATRHAGMAVAAGVAAGIALMVVN